MGGQGDSGRPVRTLCPGGKGGDWTKMTAVKRGREEDSRARGHKTDKILRQAWNGGLGRGCIWDGPPTPGYRNR